MNIFKSRIFIAGLISVFAVLSVSGYIIYRQEIEADQVADLSGQIYIIHEPSEGSVKLPLEVKANITTALDVKEVKLAYRRKWFLFYGLWKTKNMEIAPVSKTATEILGTTEIDVKGEIPSSKWTRYVNYKIVAQADSFTKAKTLTYTLKVGR